MIELVRRCRTCGTECTDPSTCDACGEGPVGLWVPGQERYVSEAEAEELRRRDALQEAEKARRERWLRWVRPWLEGFRRLRPVLRWLRRLLTKNGFQEFAEDHLVAMLSTLVIGGAIVFALLTFLVLRLSRPGSATASSPRVQGPVGGSRDESYVDLQQAILVDSMDQVEAFLRSGRSPDQEAGLETALDQGRFAIALRLLDCPGYQEGRVASWRRGPGFLARAVRLRAEPRESGNQKEVIQRLISRGASPEEELLVSAEGAPEVFKTARELARERGLDGLLPPADSAWVPCRQAPVRSCLSDALLSAADIPELIPPKVPMKANATGGFHPRNARRSPEVGEGSYGYQLRLKPRAGYRLIAKGETPIPGLKDGVLLDVADEQGYTKFIRMPVKVPVDGWTFNEVVGDMNGHLGSYYYVTEETSERRRPGAPYSLELKPSGSVFFGRTDAQGQTVYAMDRVPGESSCTVFEGESMGGWCADQIEFKADCFGPRRGHVSENLRLIEDLFRENADLVQCLRGKLAQRKGSGPVTHRHHHREVTWEVPEEELDKAERLYCHLRACRAAFLLGNGEGKRAEKDLDHLAACPSLDSRDLLLLRAIVTALGGGEDPRLRILETKLEAID